MENESKKWQQPRVIAVCENSLDRGAWRAEEYEGKELDTLSMNRHARMHAYKYSS